LKNSRVSLRIILSSYLPSFCTLPSKVVPTHWQHYHNFLSAYRLFYCFSLKITVALFSLIFTVVFDPLLSLFSFSDDKIDNMSDSFELHPSKEYHKLRGKCGEFSSSQESKSFVFVFSRKSFSNIFEQTVTVETFS
jgi:hypothetical protein